MVQERSMQEILMSAVRDTKTRYALIAAGVFILGVAGYYGYRWHQKKTMQQAHRQFSESIEEYKKALHKPSLWNEVEDVFGLGRDNNKGSALEPFFMWHQAQALIAQEKYTQAVALMHDALALTPADSALLPLMRISYSLVRIDAGQASEGIADLEKLAHDLHNPYRDIALFYAGEYYNTHGDSGRAHALWHELLEAFPPVQGKGFNRSRDASPWSALVPESTVSLLKK
jgi:predicted negative regulator of RcsB-dependent stress response